MSDEIEVGSIEQLKLQADLLGVKYRANIGYSRLEEMVLDALKEKDLGQETQRAKEATKEKEVMSARDNLMKLKRIQVQCMNPAKAEWDGEFFTISNKAVGTVKKFVPYNGADEGWHVPQIIYDFLKEAKCQIFYTHTDDKGNKSRRGKLINEYNIVDLPPLSKKELQELARKQAMARNID